MALPDPSAPEDDDNRPQMKIIAQPGSVIVGAVQTYIGALNIFTSEGGIGPVLEEVLSRPRGKGPAQSKLGMLANNVQKEWAENLFGGDLDGAPPMIVTFEDIVALTDLQKMLADSLQTEAPMGPVLNASFPDLAAECGYSMLLIGRTGSGKSTCLDALVGHLLQEATTNPAARVPVPLSLRDWSNTSGGFATWVAEQIARKHKIGIRTAAALLDQDRLILILDALDEARDPVACANSIAKTLGQREYCCIITCRTSAFERHKFSLPLRRTIGIVPMPGGTILDYLQSLGTGAAGLAEAISTSESLRSLCDRPLFLRLAISEFRSGFGLPPQSTTVLTSDSLIEHFLLRQMGSDSIGCTPEEALSCLSNVAVIYGYPNRNDIRFAPLFGDAGVPDEWATQLDDRNYAASWDARQDHEIRENTKRIARGKSAKWRYKPKMGPIARRLRVAEVVSRTFALVAVILLVLLLDRVLSLGLLRSMWPLLLSNWGMIIAATSFALLIAMSRKGRSWLPGSSIGQYVRAVLIVAATYIIVANVAGAAPFLVLPASLVCGAWGIPQAWKAMSDRISYFKVSQQPERIVYGIWFVKFYMQSGWPNKNPRKIARPSPISHVLWMQFFLVAFVTFMVIAFAVGISGGVNEGYGSRIVISFGIAGLGVALLLLPLLFYSVTYYYLAAITYKVFPRRPRALLKLLLDKGVLQRHEGRLRAMHDEIYRYLVKRSAFRVTR